MNHGGGRAGSVNAARLIRIGTDAEGDDRHSDVRENPSSFQPSIPPIIFLTNLPKDAMRRAPRSAPLQCGPPQYTTNRVSGAYGCRLRSTNFP